MTIKTFVDIYIKKYKPIICPRCEIMVSVLFQGENTSSPHYGDEDPRKVKPRFEKVVERRHPLYKAHETYREVLDSNDPKGAEIHKQIQDLESICVDGYSMMGDPSGSKVSNIFQHMVDLEMNFYHK